TGWECCWRDSTFANHREWLLSVLNPARSEVRRATRCAARWQATEPKLRVAFPRLRFRLAYDFRARPREIPRALALSWPAVRQQEAQQDRTQHFAQPSGVGTTRASEKHTPLVALAVERQSIAMNRTALRHPA